MITTRQDRILLAQQALNYALGKEATEHDRQRAARIAQILGVEVDDPMILAMAVHMDMVKISVGNTMVELNSALTRFDNIAIYVKTSLEVTRRDIKSETEGAVVEAKRKLQAATASYFKNFEADFRLEAKVVLHDLHKEMSSKEIISLRADAEIQTIKHQRRVEEVKTHEKLIYDRKLERMRFHIFIVFIGVTPFFCAALYLICR